MVGKDERIDGVTKGIDDTSGYHDKRQAANKQNFTVGSSHRQNKEYRYSNSHPGTARITFDRAVRDQSSVKRAEALSGDKSPVELTDGDDADINRTEDSGLRPDPNMR